jgi:hypothetical protein
MEIAQLKLSANTLIPIGVPSRHKRILYHYTVFGHSAFGAVR